MENFMTLFPITRLPKVNKVTGLPVVEYEYLLIISPSKSISADVMKMKHIFTVSYGCEYAASLIPNIALINFVQGRQGQKKIIQYLNRFFKALAPLNVELNGFGQFSPTTNSTGDPVPGTIYVDVQTKLPILKITGDIKKKFGRYFKPSRGLGANFATNPHLTIARQLTADQHTRAWQDLKAIDFKGDFCADHATLLRRDLDGGKYETLARFNFEGTGNPGDQLQLVF